MSVPSLQFLLLAAIAAVAFHLSSVRSWRQLVMLAVNIGFLATFCWSNPLGILPFAGFLLLGYAGLHRMARGVGWLLVLGIVLAFFWLKKYTFVPGPLLLPFPYVTIGLSYVFFRVLHLAIDSQQQSLVAKPGPVSYLNYTLNFTSLVSGPIQRYDDYRPMEEAPLRLTLGAFGTSLERIVTGFFKVFVVSAALSAIRDHLVESLAPQLPFLTRVLIDTAIVAIYPVYLFFNFSGYTDFVIGVARWFGLVLPENFNRPFQATDFIMFWTRWHMTLSNWLKTYVYQPLLIGMMGKLPDRKYESALVVFALFVTFFLVGAWHGQTTTFLFYGVLQGLGISVNKLYQLTLARRLGKKSYRALTARPLYVACARGLTFTWFSFTLLWFWSDWSHMRALREAGGTEAALLTWPLLFVIATLVLAAWVALYNGSLSVSWSGHVVLRSRYARVMWATALVTVSISVIVLLNSPAPPIVYKNF